MGLARPEDLPTVKAAATDFFKRCLDHGLAPEQIIQASILVGSFGIHREAGNDESYAMDLVKRYEVSLRSAVVMAQKDGGRSR